MPRFAFPVRATDKSPAAEAHRQIDHYNLESGLRNLPMPPAIREQQKQNEIAPMVTTEAGS